MNFIEQWLDPERQDEISLKEIAKCCICGKPGPAMCRQCSNAVGITKPSVKVEPIKV